MITAEQVKDLNKKIESLNAESTRAKAKLEVLESNLAQAIKDYLALYGVDLQGKSLKATAGKIRKELDWVEAEVQKEFALRQQVVEAIERGDIDEANRLLGVELPTDEDDEAEVEVKVEEPKAEVTTQEVQSADIPAVVEDTPVSEGSNDSDEDDFNFDFSIDDEEEDNVGAIFEDEDDVEEVDAASFLSAVQGNTKSTPQAKTAPVQSPEKTVTGTKKSPARSEAVSRRIATKKSGAVPAGSMSASAAVDSLDIDGFGELNLSEEEMDDFGFGDMLSGTKFSLDD